MSNMADRHCLPFVSASPGFVVGQCCSYLFAVLCAFTLCSASCVPNVASVSGLHILDRPSIFSNVYCKLQILTA
jgi:hypothetical protein